MNINTNSWHYKLVKNTLRDSDKPIPSSLCPYFRAVMYRVLFFGTLASGFSFMLANMLADPIAALGVKGLWVYVASFFGSIAMLGGILAFAFGVAFGVAFGGMWIYQRVSEWRNDRKYVKRMAKLQKEAEDRENGIEPKAPNIVLAFLKAKHEQICPTLNFVKGGK